MRRLFPLALQKLCIFHLSKACFTNVQTKGLLPVYNVPEGKELLRCFPALAFLPPEEVVDGYHDVCTALDALVPSVIPERYRENLNSKGDTCDYVQKILYFRVRSILQRHVHRIQAWSRSASSSLLCRGLELFP